MVLNSLINLVYHKHEMIHTEKLKEL